MRSPITTLLLLCIGWAIAAFIPEVYRHSIEHRSSASNFKNRRDDSFFSRPLETRDARILPRATPLEQLGLDENALAHNKDDDEAAVAKAVRNYKVRNHPDKCKIRKPGESEAARQSRQDQATSTCANADNIADAALARLKALRKAKGIVDKSDSKGKTAEDPSRQQNSYHSQAHAPDGQPGPSRQDSFRPQGHSPYDRPRPSRQDSFRQPPYASDGQPGPSRQNSFRPQAHPNYDRPRPSRQESFGQSSSAYEQTEPSRHPSPERGRDDDFRQRRPSEPHRQGSTHGYDGPQSQRTSRTDTDRPTTPKLYRDHDGVRKTRKLSPDGKRTIPEFRRQAPRHKVSFENLRKHRHGRNDGMQAVEPEEIWPGKSSGRPKPILTPEHSPVRHGTNDPHMNNGPEIEETWPGKYRGVPNPFGRPEHLPDNRKTDNGPEIEETWPGKYRGEPNPLRQPEHSPERPRGRNDRPNRASTGAEYQRPGSARRSSTRRGPGQRQQSRGRGTETSRAQVESKPDTGCCTVM